MAHIKASATTKGNRDSKPKMLGIKLYSGEKAKPGSILVRQRGSLFRAGLGTKMGKDDTIYAIKEGFVAVVKKLGNRYLTVRD